MIKDGIKDGTIVNVSSINTICTFHTQSAYATAKAGIECFTRCVAEEMAKNGIRCNCIRPGLTDTPMISEITKEEYQAIVDRIPLGRAAFPDEIAELAFFLSSKKSSYITGVSIPISGGFTM